MIPAYVYKFIQEISIPNSTQNCLGSTYKYLKGIGIIQEL